MILPVFLIYITVYFIYVEVGVCVRVSVGIYYMRLVNDDWHFIIVCNCMRDYVKSLIAIYVCIGLVENNVSPFI